MVAAATMVATRGDKGRNGGNVRVILNLSLFLGVVGVSSRQFHRQQQTEGLLCWNRMTERETKQETTTTRMKKQEGSG